MLHPCAKTVLDVGRQNPTPLRGRPPCAKKVLDVGRPNWPEILPPLRKRKKFNPPAPKRCWTLDGPNWPKILPPCAFPPPCAKNLERPKVYFRLRSTLVFFWVRFCKKLIHLCFVLDDAHQEHKADNPRPRESPSLRSRCELARDQERQGP